MPSTKYDLHCHSTASDGTLHPEELLHLARKCQIQTLALTDHDTTHGLAEAKIAAGKLGIHLVPGIELSTTWNNKSFHIIGLNIDVNNPSLKSGIRGLQDLRLNRARSIAAKLEKSGAGKDIFDSVKRSAGNGMITRTHFAKYLVEAGYASSVKDIFRKFLVPGKPGYVSTKWADLSEAIQWINDAGGVAVVAHPMRYKLTTSWINKFLTAFKAEHGIGIEVVCGNNTSHDTHATALLAKRYGLAGSVGSDFHSPENTWTALGQLKRLPKGIEPIWSHFSPC